ncbi:hypothetical protein CRG98_038403 [Punica granatum]|uniref:CASP-like protein n=1 Tax=Punica granatum TaxID=22663 RepID=A0A2I0IB37_PUNGR|nr:hypothetical protein CRG98_038403 [Punica granatum]
MTSLMGPEIPVDPHAAAKVIVQVLSLLSLGRGAVCSSLDVITFFFYDRRAGRPSHHPYDIMYQVSAVLGFLASEILSVSAYIMLWALVLLYR